MQLEPEWLFCSSGDIWIFGRKTVVERRVPSIHLMGSMYQNVLVQTYLGVYALCVTEATVFTSSGFPAVRFPIVAQLRSGHVRW